jgi:hypothetical protein
MHTYEDEEDPNGKLRGNPKLKPKPSLRQEKRSKNEIERTLLATQEISLICLEMLLMTCHTTK